MFEKLNIGAVTTPQDFITSRLEEMKVDVTADNLEEFKIILGDINQQMKTNAVIEALNADDIFTSLWGRITYGRYTISSKLELGHTNKVMKKVITGKADGKNVVEERPDFITYADVVNFVEKYNKEVEKYNKDNPDKKDFLSIPGDLSSEQKWYFTIFGHNLCDTLTAEDTARLKRLRDYDDFIEAFDKDSNTGKVQQLQFLYDCISNHTSKPVKAIGAVVRNLPYEFKRYSSKFKNIKILGTTDIISGVLNEMINSDMAVGMKNKLGEVAEEVK